MLSRDPPTGRDARTVVSTNEIAGLEATDQSQTRKRSSRAILPPGTNGDDMGSLLHSGLSGDEEVLLMTLGGLQEKKKLFIAFQFNQEKKRIFNVDCQNQSVRKLKKSKYIFIIIISTD